MPRDAQETFLAALLIAPTDDIQVAPRERALLAYADILTLKPAAVTNADVTALRDAGFDDRGIHDACAIIAYFAFVNRIADGLGVEIEHPRSAAR